MAYLNTYHSYYLPHLCANTPPKIIYQFTNARVSATFTINFEARPPSPVQVDTKTVDLPAVPDSVNGTCILETEKAKIFIFWSGYNFTLEFIKNPEGNSYYMNRALLQYNTKHPDLAK